MSGEPVRAPLLPSPSLLRSAEARLGLLGSVLLLVASAGRGTFRTPSRFDALPVLGWFRTTHPGHMLATVAFFAGIVLLTTAWLRLGRRLTAHQTPPVSQLWRVAALWSAPLLVALPLGSRDVYSYLAQGQLALQGLDPYTQGPAYLPGPLLDAVSTTWWLTPAPYGPAFLGLTEEIGRLSGGGVLRGVLLVRVLVVLSLVATAWLVRHLAQAVGADPARATWLALLNPLVALHLVAGLHNEAFIVPLVLAGTALAVSRRPLLAAVVVAVAAAVKVTAVVALPFIAVLWVLQRRRTGAPAWAHPWAHVRSLLAAFVAVGLVGLVGLATLSTLSGYGFTWLTAIGESTSHGSRLSLSTTIAEPVAALVGLVAGPAAAAHAATAVVMTGLLLAAVLCARLLLRPVGTAAEVLVRCGLAMTAVAVLSPVFHPWYLLPGLALVAVGGAGPRTTRATVALTVLLLVLVRPSGSEVLHLGYPFDLTCAALALALLVREVRRAAHPVQARAEVLVTA